MKKFFTLFAFIGFSLNLMSIDCVSLSYLATGQSDWGEMTTDNSSVWTYNSNYGAYGKKKGGDTGNLLTPALDLSGLKSVTLSFQHAHKFAQSLTEEFTLWVTSDYKGSVDSSSWTQLKISPYSSNSDWNYVSVSIDVPIIYVGEKTVFAFRYKSSSTNYATWEIKNLKISGECDVLIGDIYYDLNINSKTAIVVSCIPGLTNAVIQNSVTYDNMTFLVTGIGDNAFNNCTELTSVTIGNNVTSIGKSAFYGCSSLTSIVWNAKNCGDFSPSNTPFYNDDELYDYIDIGSQISSFTFGEDVEHIPAYLFYGINNLASVTIPSSVTNIGEFAFLCDGLTRVNISDLTAWCNISFADDVANPLYSAGHLFLNGEEIVDLVIPNSVTSIGNYTFGDCIGLTSVTIPNSVTSIGNSAFNSCSGLTSITIPNSVTSIGHWAFMNCSNLTSVTIPSSISSIGQFAFSNTDVNEIYYDGSIIEWCNKSWYPSDISSNYRLYFNGEKVETCEIPSSFTSIGSRVFSGCSSLISVTIPNSVTSIGYAAFSGCISLNSVTIPNEVTNIEEYAFGNVPNIMYSGTATGAPWGARSMNGFVDGWLVYSDESKTQLLACSAEAKGEVYIPNSVTSIGNIAFYNCSSLTNITIPNSVTSIGDYAFGNCSGLTSVAVPNSITSIGDYTFYGCSSLTSATIPNSVTSIGNYAFCNCSSLTYVDIPNSVTSIGAGAFCKCSGLTTIVIPESVSIIKKFTFAYCRNLASLTIPNSVTNIGNDSNSVTLLGEVSFDDGAFSNCSSLTSLHIPNSVTSIGNYAFKNCSGLKSVDIPNSVTSIGDYTFYGCNGLSMMNIPNSVTSIGQSAFSDCSSLTSATIGNSITSISEYTFYGCSKLTSVTIGNNVTSIGKCAFYGCSNLTSIMWNAKNCGDFSSFNTPFYKDGERYDYFDIRSQISSFTFGEEVEHIPANLCNSLSNIVSVTIPNRVTSIGDSAFYDCSSLISVIMNSDSVVSKEYSGDFNFKNIFGIQVKEYILGEGITNIGGSAFRGCKSLTTVSISNSVTSLGYASFAYCDSLRSLTIPNSVTSIGDYTFYNCSNLTSVTIGNNVTSIGLGAFYNCSGLTSVTIPESVTSIGKGATFQNCTALESVQWNAKNCTINEYNNRYYSPFLNLSNITSFSFGENVETIPASLCDGLSGLTAINLPHKVTSVGDYAFYNCSGLTSIEISNNLTNIGEWAFYNCSGLTSITIPESVTSIGKGGTFQNCTALESVQWNAKNCTIEKNDNGSYNPPFYNLSNITNFTIGKDVEAIPTGLCHGLSGLDAIDLPRMVTSIDMEAFYGCSGLTSLTIPNSVIIIGNSAFFGCNNLNSVTIGQRVTSIGEFAFEGCSNITSVTWNAKNGDRYYFGNQIESFNFGDKVEIIPDSICRGMSLLTSMPIPNSVTSIGNNAFYGCSSLTDVFIPNNVTSIGNSAFEGCRSLVAATIGNGVKYLGEQAFYDCQNLETISIGNSMESIGDNAFSGCERIIDIYSYAERVPTAQSSTFDGVSRKAYLWVPANRVRNYKTHEIWGEFDVHAIEADEVNTSTVKIVPSDNTAKIIWPQVEDAETYEITIYDQNGNIVCTLVFNSDGLLQSIEFAAPGRDNDREAVQATGFRFEVTGLTAGTEYTYTIVAKDAAETIIDTQEGYFTTTGDSPTAVVNASVDAESIKIIRDGQLFILRDGKTYTVQGQEVR